MTICKKNSPFGRMADKNTVFWQMLADVLDYIFIYNMWHAIIDNFGTPFADISKDCKVPPKNEY